MGNSILNTWLNFLFLTQHWGATSQENQGLTKTQGFGATDSRRLRRLLRKVPLLTTQLMLSHRGTTKFTVRKAAAKCNWHCDKVDIGNIEGEMVHCAELKGGTAEREDAKVLAIIQTSLAPPSREWAGPSAAEFIQPRAKLLWKWLPSEAQHVVSDGKYDNVCFLYKKTARWKSCVVLFVSQEHNKHRSRSKKRKKKQGIGRDSAIFILWTNFPRRAANDLQRPPDWLKLDMHLYGQSWKSSPSRSSWASEITSPYFFLFNQSTSLKATR